MVIEGTVTLNLALSPVELTLLQDCLNERIGWLDSEYDRIRRLATEADAYTSFVEGMETNRIMRAHYSVIARKVSMLLETPFIDTEPAIALLWERA